MAVNFIDYVKFEARSGRGGAGSAHLRREKFVPKGGPDGGDGGRGGHIILQGNAQLWTLLHLKYQKHVIAKRGENGAKQRRSGSQGEDVTLEVPLGTLAKNADTGEVVAEITEDGQEAIILEGGRGGLGNDHFKTPTLQTPRFAQPGEDGKEQWFILELKVLADVGLIGFPNAGKSTLLSVLSAARPEIADYPFTTLTPNLGVVDYRNYQSFVVADIPGIIEGAAEGKGLGTRFLRHAERNAILLFVIAADTPNINDTFNTLLSELEAYNPEMLDKQRLLAISKADLLDKELMEALEQEITIDIPHLFVSSVTQYHLSELKDLLWQTLHH